MCLCQLAWAAFIKHLDWGLSERNYFLVVLEAGSQGPGGSGGQAVLRAPCLAGRWLLLTVCSRGREKERSSSLSFLRRAATLPSLFLVGAEPEKEPWQRICLQCRRPEFDPWIGKSPRGGLSNPLQDFCWEIPWTVEPGGL